ncbi:MAG: hypothetical protein DHS20C14_10020 [Phycisphaeraceae bacterium]|nr:MAG: hypothetical protein DHS20C14_10020 [Phycisphaeraceae bacterium]
MASINPTASSFQPVRPFQNNVAARFSAAKAAPTDGPRTGDVKPDSAREELTIGRTAKALAAAEVGKTDPGTATPNSNVAPNSAGEAPVSEPLDLSGISDRTQAVLDHTLAVLSQSAGVKDPEALSAVLSNIVGPLVAQDGVANPEAATAQYVQEMIAKMLDSDSAEPGIGLRASTAAPGGIDLEG